MPAPDDPDVKDFFASFNEARYSTPDNDPAYPIILWGVLKGERTPFAASPSDYHDYGRDLYAQAINGDFGEIEPYEPPPPRPEPPSPVKRPR